METVIRSAALADAERLALVGAATFLETFAGILDGQAIVAHCRAEHNMEAYRRYLQAGAAWLAETAAGAAPVGYALVGRNSLPGAKAGDLELKRIYLLSRMHGGGLGKALLDHIVDHAQRSGAPRLLLGVYAGNERALAFYARHGFAHIGDRRFRVGDRNYDDRILAKPLS